MSVRWEDDAFVLSIRKHGETSGIVSVLTQEHGRCCGMVKGAFAKQKRGIFLPGNRIHASWTARLEEQLGTMSGELLTPFAAHAMTDSLMLGGLQSACALLETVLAERDPAPELYAGLEGVFTAMETPLAFLHAYVLLELEILRHGGVGLDLSCCAATGVVEDLCYVSPKTGRAVSREPGEPYRSKLLPLPAFLSSAAAPQNRTEICEGLALTSYFLEHHLLPALHRRMPAVRQRWMIELN